MASRGGRGRPVLTEEQRIKAIQCLACFDTPKETHKELKALWPDLEITVQAIEALDPTKYAGRDLAPRWRTIFETVRKKFLEETADIGIANPAYRLRQLDKIAKRSIDKGNDVLALSALEQAAKESGGAYTNRRELGGPNGAPLAVTHNIDREELVDAIKGVASWLD